MSVNKKNIFLKNTITSEQYVSRSAPINKRYPKRENISAHAKFIKRKLRECYEYTNEEKKAAAIRYKEGV